VDALPIESPHPAAEAIWESWRSGMPRDNNRWAEYSSDKRRAWLQAAALHSRWARSRAIDRPAGGTYEIDGEHITDLPGFYCAMGEAINGPGGYFGRDFDGLRDCLRGGFGVSVPFTLVWLDSRVARGGIGEPGFADILHIFADMGVTTSLR
jgi:RNAse (barnase) inhibitor barstar